MPCPQANKKYLVIAKSMKQYDDDLYERWIQLVDTIIPELMKRTVLTKPPPPSSLTPLPHSDSRAPSRSKDRELVQCESHDRSSVLSSSLR